MRRIAQIIFIFSIIGLVGTVVLFILPSYFRLKDGVEAVQIKAVKVLSGEEFFTEINLLKKRMEEQKLTKGYTTFYWGYQDTGDLANVGTFYEEVCKINGTAGSEHWQESQKFLARQPLWVWTYSVVKYLPLLVIFLLINMLAGFRFFGSPAWQGSLLEIFHW